MRARTDCAALVGKGRVRINRQPTDKPHAKLRIGDVLTVPLRGDVRVVRVLALAGRRGPASEARLLYEDVAENATPSCAGPSCAREETPAYRQA
jgi:ribosome-associated heat shock protein Hsp15